MSFANGKNILSTKIRGIPGTEVSHGARCQTREATFTSEDLTESNKTSTKVVKTQRIVQRTSYNRDPMFNRLLATRRVPKKHSNGVADAIALGTANKRDSERKTTTRSHENPPSSLSSQPPKSVFFSNGIIPSNSDQKPVNSSRMRELKSESPLMGKFRIQNGWIRPSPSPLAIRTNGPFGQLGRQAHGVLESGNPTVTAGSLTMRSTKTNPVTKFTSPVRFSAEENQYLDGMSDKNKSSNPPKQEYTTDSVISAWLLQCNNASVMLDGTDSTDEDEDRVVVKKVVEEDGGITVQDKNEFKTYQQETLAEKEDSSSSTVPTMQLEAFFTAPVPNKLAQSSQFVRSPTYAELRNPTCMNDVACSGSSSGLPASINGFKRRINIDIPGDREPLPKDELSSANAQDWTSVSSSEWGDDMCEFDRQQSQKVREMFEEIDRMLFDSPRQESSKSKHSSPNHPSLEDFKEQADGNFDVSHLKGECEDWLSRFPHLRVVGTQLIPSRDQGYEFYSSPNVNTHALKALSNLHLNATPREASMMRLVGSSSVPNLVQTNAKGESFELTTLDSSNMKADNHVSSQGNASPAQLENSTSSISRFNMYGAEEEIFAIDGEYEEMIMIDHDPGEDSSVTPRPKRRISRGEQSASRVYPGKGNLNSKLSGKHDGSCSAAREQSSGEAAKSHSVGAERSRSTNWLCETFVDLLVKEINNDLLSWLRALTPIEASNDYPSSVGQRIDSISLDDTTTPEFSITRVPCQKGDVHVALHAIHERMMINEEPAVTSSTHAFPTDSEISATSLTGLLQISTKALQQRDRTSTHDLLDSANRIHTIDQVSSMPSTSWMTQVNRSSPQPMHGCPITPVSNRPFSGVNVKTVPSSSRKTTNSSGSTAVTDTINAAGFSPSVIGVAASFHPVGRLAPLDRVRTPGGFHPVGSHTTEEFISTASETSSHVIQRNKIQFTMNSHNVFLSHPHSVQHASPMSQTTPSQMNSMTIHPAANDPSSGRGGCTLPPLGTGSVTSGAVLGTLIQSSTNVPSLPAASRLMPSNARSVNQTSNQQNTATQQPQPQHPAQSHAPALRGTSANLVTQQINNSGLLFQSQGQRTGAKTGPRSTRTKQNVTPSLMRRNKKTWRPHTSISTDKNNKNTCLPQVIDRSSSTLLIRRIADPSSEYNSPRKL